MLYEDFFNIKQQDYILNYKIKNNNIIVKYANGRTIKIPYSSSKEQQILNQRKNQIKKLNQSNDQFSLPNRWTYIDKINLRYSLCILTISLLLNAIGLTQDSYIWKILWRFLGVSCSFISIPFFFEIIHHQIKIHAKRKQIQKLQQDNQKQIKKNTNPKEIEIRLTHQSIEESDKYSFQGEKRTPPDNQNNKEKIKKLFK